MPFRQAGVAARRSIAIPELVLPFDEYAVRRDTPDKEWLLRSLLALR